MAKKIAVKEAEVDDDPNLIEKVDEMMDPEEQATKASDGDNDQPTTDDPTPLDIFADTPSAPLLKIPKGKKIIKDVLVKDEPAEPLAEAVDPEPEHQDAENKQEVVEALPIQLDPEEEKVISPRREAPKEYDDPTTAKAIDDIVAQESDEVLLIEDHKIADKKVAAGSGKSSGHPIFWSLVVIVCLIGIAMAVFIVDPSIHDPLSKVHWSSITKHL